MARFAVGDRMRAGKSESFGGMKVKRALPILPIARSMTILAVQPKLTVVMVGVTINATGADMAKDRFLVTTDALGDSVRPHQMISGRGVIEFKRVAHLRP